MHRIKITARGATDGANIVLFWPDNLPIDGDEILERDPLGFVESLRDGHKLIWFPCDSDGDYTVAIFLNEALPGDLIPYCKEEECISALLVCGVGYFGGMEYMFKKDRRLLDRYPGMCEPVIIPAGTYTARVYQTHVPESVYEDWLESHAGCNAKRLWDMHATITASAIVGVLVTLLAIGCVPWTVGCSMTAIASTLVMVAVAISRTDGYKSVARAQDEFEKSYPAYVVHLESTGPREGFPDQETAIPDAEIHSRSSRR